MTTPKRTTKPIPEKEQQPDPKLCRCEGVPRRYDGDGLLERREGAANLYRCARCGKGYE